MRAYLHVFQAVLLADAPQHILLAALLHLARKQQLIKYEVRLLKVEDDVELADVAIVFVHLFHVAMDNLKCDQFIVRRGAAGNEEEGSIAAIDNFRFCRVNGRPSAQFE